MIANTTRKNGVGRLEDADQGMKKVDGLLTVCGGFEIELRSSTRARKGTKEEIHGNIYGNR